MPVVEWFAAQLMRWRHGSRSISISRHTSRWHPTDAGVGGWWSLTDEVRDRKCSAAVINVGSRRHYSFGGGSDRATALMRRFMAGRWDAARPPVSGCRPTRDKQDSDSNYFLQVEPSSLSVSNFFVVDNNRRDSNFCKKTERCRHWLFLHAAMSMQLIIVFAAWLTDCCQLDS